MYTDHKKLKEYREAHTCSCWTITELRDKIKELKEEGYKVNRADYFDFLNKNMNTIILTRDWEEYTIYYEGE